MSLKIPVKCRDFSFAAYVLAVKPRLTSKMQEEIIIDNFDENEEFVEATSTDLMKASSNDANELIISGKKRRQECE